MSSRRPEIDGFVNIKIISMKVSGKPSAVHSATVRLFYPDGTVIDQSFSMEPDGVMFENFEEAVRNIRKQLG